MFRLLKTIIITAVLAFLTAQPLHAFNSANPLDVAILPTTSSDIEEVEKHHPFFGLFGAGYTNYSAEEIVASGGSFTEYYDFCKDHGNGSDLAADLNIAKTHFREIINLLQSNTPGGTKVPINNFIISDNVFFTTPLNIQNNSDLTEDQINALFDSWRDKFFCDKGYSFELIVIPTSRTYEAMSSENIVQVGSFDRHTDTNEDPAHHYWRYCYTTAEEAKLDRDIILFLSESNTEKIKAKISASGENSLTAFLQVLLFDPVTLDLALNNFVALDGLSFYKFRIQPFSLAGFTQDTNVASRYNALAANSDLEESGLGYFCEQIYTLHNNAENAANKTDIETCIKDHVTAVVATANAHPTGICADNKCDTVVFGDGPTALSAAEGLITDVNIRAGFVLNNIYSFPSFAYCSNDDDFDGFITVEGTYNWGTFDAAGDVPFANVGDVCPTSNAGTTSVPTWFRDVDGDGHGDPAVSQTGCTQPGADFVLTNTDICPSVPTLNTTLATFFQDLDGNGLGNPLVTTTNCVAPTGFVSNNSDRAEGFTFNISTANNQVTVSRNAVVTGRIKELRISTSNTGVQIQGILTDDSTIIVQDTANQLQASREGGNITKYCLRVKGNLSTLTTQYMLIIPATGENIGLVQSTYIVDTEPMTLKEISLNSSGAVVEGNTLVQEAGAQPCDFTVQ